MIVDGKKWDVTYSIQYMYKASFDASQLRPGENFMEVSDYAAGKEGTHVNSVNNTGGMKVGAQFNPPLMTHETGHFIGFGDKRIIFSSTHNRSMIVDYFQKKYGKVPGGEAYKIIQMVDKYGIKVETQMPGFSRSNHMAFNGGEWSPVQVESLVRAALSAANNADNQGFELTGIFDESTNLPISKEKIAENMELIEQSAKISMQKESEGEKNENSNIYISYYLSSASVLQKYPRSTKTS